MIGLENSDTSFFFIAPTTDIGLKNSSVGQLFKNKSFANDLISFSVTEEMGKPDRGSLSVYDDNNFYSQMLRSGVSFDLVWGYRKNVFQIARDIALDALKKTDANLFKGGKWIRKLKGITISPSGSGDGSGRIVYNCSFYGTSWVKKSVTKVWSGVTKGNMVRVILYNQLKAKYVFVDFSAQNQVLTYPNVIRQNDPPVNFLNKMAKKEKAFFKIGTTQDGEIVALFFDKNKVNNQDIVLFSKLITGAISGNRIEFNYRVGDNTRNDVQNFSWTQNVGENGTGDGVSIMYLNGKPTFIRYVAGQQTTTGYRLNTNEISRVMGSDPAKGFEIMQKLLKIDNFETLVKKKFFTPIKITSAPEGFGFRMNLELGVGNPYITTPCRAYFNKGFPLPFTDNRMSFWIQSVTHNIGQNGYRQSVVVADTFTITGGSLIGAVGWTPTG